MDQRISKVRGVGAKVRGYLKSMHPEFTNKTSAREFLEKHPNLESLVEAINAHDPSINPRSMSSIRGNMRAAYEYLGLVSQTQQSRPGSNKRMAEDSGGEPPAKRQQTNAASLVMPAALSRPVPNPGDKPIEPALDQLASSKDTEVPFGNKEQMFKDQVENVEQPVQTNTQQWKTNSLLQAGTEAKAIDMAEEDPIKPNKELEFIPDHVETALVSTQDEHYLEHRNANQLMHTTILPAAALTNNDGAGVREAIRRSDRDMEVEVENQEDEAKQILDEQKKGGGSRGAGRGAGAKKVIPPEQSMTIAQQLKGVLGDQVKSITRGIMGTLGAASGIPGATLLAEPVARAAGAAAEEGIGYQDIMTRLRKEGRGPEDVRKIMQEIKEQTGVTELEEKGERLHVDDLRPFLPVAGAMDVELAPGDIEQKKRNVKLFNNYKPPNWPLGNIDNKLYFQNLVLQGIHWESPLDSLPQVLPGGSLLAGTQEFQSDIFIPDDTTLRDRAVEKQVEFKIPGDYGRHLLKRMHKMLGAMARTQITKGDTKYIHNPRALGVNMDAADGNFDFNPLDTPMHADLQVGGTRELRPLIPKCDADALIQQIGQAGTQIPNEVYTSNPLFNPFAMYPKRF